MSDPKFTITTSFNQDLIHQRITDPLGQVVEQWIHLQDQQVRSALIKLGWTPPKADRAEAGE